MSKPIISGADVTPNRVNTLDAYKILADVTSIVFTDIDISPNPVNTKSNYKIAVRVAEAVKVLMAKSSNILLTEDTEAMKVKGDQ